MVERVFMPVENPGDLSTSHPTMTRHAVSLYESTPNQLVGQLRELSGDDVLTIVPGCPEWSVKDVVAHVCGLTADIQNKVQGSLGSDENTTRQVATRGDMTMTQICDEWMANTRALDWRSGMGARRWHPPGAVSWPKELRLRSLS